MRNILYAGNRKQPAVALIENNRLLEYWPLPMDLDMEPEAVLLGRAGRVMKGLSALFVQLPGGVEGFLPFSQLRGQDTPRPGDSLLVQVKKAALANKAPYLTQDITLVGRDVVLLPMGEGGHASARADNRAQLAEVAEQLCPKGMGLILRSSAESAQLTDLEAQRDALLHQWEEIASLARQTTSPKALWPGVSPLTRLLRELKDWEVTTLRTDDPKALHGLSSLIPPGVQVVEDDQPFYAFDVEVQLLRAFKRRVYLPSGGTLVIDPCEAATVIDVNSAKDTRPGVDAALRVNLEAAEEIARLLRLRRVGGMVIIDMIDMKAQEHQELVISRLKEALAADPVKTEVLGFTRLGLLEMTRRRVAEPLPAERLCPPYALCEPAMLTSPDFFDHSWENMDA